MNSYLKRLYDLMPTRAQSAMLTAFSARLERQRYGGRFNEFRQLLEQSQWWDRSKIESFQDERLRSIVAHAYETVPYYHSLFDLHGIKANAFRGREDLHRIPLLTRATIKSHAQELKSRQPAGGSLSQGHTSGTTGSPLTVYFCADMVAINYPAMDRQYQWAGAKLGRDGDRVAVVRGNVIVPLKQSKPPYWRHNRNLNQLLMSSFHLQPANLTHYFDALREFRPRVLDGYPSSLYVLARVMLSRGERLSVGAVVTSSETLYDFQREAIELAFGCRVFDYYAAAERVIFSTECDRHQGHHLSDEYGITEYVDEYGAAVGVDAEGYMVGTSLHNTGMPLIRYLTTDRSSAKLKRCECGRTLQLVDDVTTKSEDLLRLRDGRLIPPSVLTHPFKPLDCIEASQLVQTDVDHLLVRLMPRPEYTQQHGEQLVRDLKIRLGQDMHITIE